jgi:hypothetical protein
MPLGLPERFHQASPPITKVGLASRANGAMGDADSE